MRGFKSDQIDEIAHWIKGIVDDEVDDATDYAEEFARHSADYAAAALIDPRPDTAERFEAQTRAFAETIKEFGDQATERIVLQMVGGIRLLLSAAS